MWPSSIRERVIPPKLSYAWVPRSQMSGRKPYPCVSARWMGLLHTLILPACFLRLGLFFYPSCASVNRRPQWFSFTQSPLLCQSSSFEWFFPVTPQPPACNWAESVTLGSDLCVLLLIPSGSPFSLISSFFALHSYSFLQSPSNHLPNSLLDTNSDSRVFVTFLVSALESHGSKRRRKRQSCLPSQRQGLPVMAKASCRDVIWRLTLIHSGKNVGYKWLFIVWC